MQIMNNTPLARSWELIVLSQCVHFKNLSIASEHVGLSQPQLSRIVKRLEEEFSIRLLDRHSKRDAAWTAEAQRLSESYERCAQDMGRALVKLRQKKPLSRLRIGTLEGLASVACFCAHQLLDQELVQSVDIEVEDLNRLSERFVEGAFDLVFTSRETGQKKHPLHRVLGYQSLVPSGRKDGPLVLSPSEAALPAKGRSLDFQVTSNSLAVRRIWISDYGARGVLPSRIYRRSDPRARSVEQKVFVIGASTLEEPVRRLLENLRVPENVDSV